jgi:hypothetical protein
MGTNTQEAFGKPSLRNATQSSGKRANETIARPNPSSTLGAGDHPEPNTAGKVAAIPETATRPSGYANEGGTKNQPARGKAVDGIPKSARPGGSTPAKGKS